MQVQIQKNPSRLALGLALSVLALSAGGCGVGKYDVTGKVIYNGAPLNKPDGEISFVGPTGELVVAPIAEDGTYRATGVVSGLNRVAVAYKNPKLKRNSKPKVGESLPPSEPPLVTPEKYGSVETSQLTVTVKQDTTYDVEMGGPNIK